MLIDVSGTGTSGYQAADWLRGTQSDRPRHERPSTHLATMSFADDKATGRTAAGRAVGVAQGGPDFRLACADPAAVAERIELETSSYPATRSSDTSRWCPAGEAGGRIAAEQITPYPPGIPAVVPGERLNDAVIDYLRSGLDAGMNVPDAADATLETFRVVVT